MAVFVFLISFYKGCTSVFKDYTKFGTRHFVQSLAGFFFLGRETNFKTKMRLRLLGNAGDLVGLEVSDKTLIASWLC